MQNISFPLIDKNLSDIPREVLSTLAYFDMFSYPLTRAEIYLFMGKKYHYEFFDSALNHLVAMGSVYQFERFFTLKNDSQLISRRVEGNARAAELMKIARKVAATLIRFPFVRGVAVSGSLSKNFADAQSDIDLFIITAKNRLWLARTLTHGLKKLSFLAGREHYFCMNYYIDEQELQIAEQNIYTAIEIGTLIPLEGDIFFEKFYATNAWTRDYLPNKTLRVASAKPVRGMPVKTFGEFLFGGGFGNTLDNLLMNITAARWRKKTAGRQVNSHGDLLAMLTGKHFSKPDPQNFQACLLLKYKRKLAELLRDFEEMPVS